MEWDEYLYAVKVYRGQAAVNRILKHAFSATQPVKVTAKIVATL